MRRPRVEHHAECRGAKTDSRSARKQLWLRRDERVNRGGESVRLSLRIVHGRDDFCGAAVSQPPKSNVCNVSIVRSNLFGAWKAPLLWLRPPDHSERRSYFPVAAPAFRAASAFGA